MKNFVYSDSFSGLVFWEYDATDCFETISKKKYNELLSDKTKTVLLPFSKCLKFDYSKLEFYYSEEDIMNSNIQLSDFENGNSYFSIVIEDEVILTGLNRMGYFGARRLKTDDLTSIFICWVVFDKPRIKLTTDYISSFNLVLDDIKQKEDLRKIDCIKIQEYFCE